MWFSIFDPRYSPAKRIQTRPNQSKVHTKRHDLPFDQIETYAKCIDPLFESRKDYVKWHDHFFDQIETYAKCIDLLFESIKGYVKRHDLLFDPKKNHAKRHSRYFCRGVLHTPPQDTLKNDVWSEMQIHVGRIQYVPTLTDGEIYF